MTMREIIPEATESKAQIAAVACPYCTIMLEDAFQIISKNDTIEVKDIIELVQEAI